MSPYNLLVAAMLGARANICGTKGYDDGTDSYYYDGSGSQGSYSACGNVCVQDSQCKSFAFSSTECLLYSVAVTGNFDADSSSAYSFYDRACFAATSSTSKSSTKLSTSTSATRTSSISVTVTSSTKTSSSSSRAISSTSSSSSTHSTTASSSSSAAPSTSSSSSSTHSTTSSSSSSATPSASSSTHSTTSSSSSSSAPVTSSTHTTLSTAASSSSSSKASTSASSSSKSSSTSVSASATPTPSSTVAVPSGCTNNISPYITVTAFSWFNSSTNLDCVAGTDQTGCLAADGSGWCTPKGTNDTSCNDCGINYCEGGLPTPPGYGPPDDIQITYTDPINGGEQCEETNPQFTRRYEVGDGQVTCGSAYPYLAFVGNSNVPSSQGTVYHNQPQVTCADGTTHAPTYAGNITLTCTYDSGNNATCTTPTLPVLIPLNNLG